MYNFYRLAGITAISLGLIACNDKSEEKLALDTLLQKASYSYGVDVATRLKQQGIDLDVKALNTGIADAYNDAPLAMDEEARIETKTQFQAELREVLAKKQAETAAANLVTGKAFLEANSKKEGVITTASGLQYKIITTGEGKQPKDTDTVTTHYVGTLIDGREFDSSVKRGQPASFPVNGVIKGWTEALQLMHVGDKWQLFIPSDLAYGPTKRSELIEENSTLIFELELLEIKDPAAANAKPAAPAKPAKK
ncbi:FKBP-type peptidyl-prolyl cis-trans isomerase FklB [hydrothermal vent metagenome]|uniref:peptidylprolyl isomerase n=1 Tax=hydrothermal vent metagenome TaxID=652676 RepID=A0A3B0WGY3_9ZZZZ